MNNECVIQMHMAYRCLSLQTIKPLVRDTEHNSRQVRPTHSDTSHIDRLGLSVTGYEAIIYHINRGRPLDVVVA